MKKGVKFIFYFTGMMFIFTQNCYAYIDPASTSYIIQIAVGIAIACGTAFGIAWNKLKRKFKNKDTSSPDTPVMENKGDKKDIITADDLLDGDE
ncbi:MAG: hypothetical protein IJR59_06690 [Firmicutes bacterium]|nr:hypothetical protein [Bacillota bacterium]